jgi:hypothetical protein
MNDSARSTARIALGWFFLLTGLVNLYSCQKDVFFFAISTGSRTNCLPSTSLKALQNSLCWLPPAA